MAKQTQKKFLNRITFVNQGTVYEIYAKKVSHGELLGFILAEDFVFGEASAVVVDPSEERLKNEFQGVKSSLIPIHSVIRIDQVSKEGTPKIMEIKERLGTVSPFPGTHMLSSTDSPGKG